MCGRHTYLICSDVIFTLYVPPSHISVASLPYGYLRRFDPLRSALPANPKPAAYSGTGSLAVLAQFRVKFRCAPDALLCR